MNPSNNKDYLSLLDLYYMSHKKRVIVFFLLRNILKVKVHWNYEEY